MTLVHPWKDMILPQLIPFSQTPRGLCFCIHSHLPRYQQAKELQHQKYFLQVLPCECISGAKAVDTCTYKSHDLPGSLGSLQLCPPLRDRSVGGCAVLWDRSENAWGIHMWMDQMWSASFRSQTSGEKQDPFCSTVVLSAASLKKLAFHSSP